MNFGTIVLAAGSSRRFGKNKLLLPFGSDRVIGQTLRRVHAAEPAEVLVITGHEAEQVREALPAGTHSVFNPDHNAGEMLSSLKTGLRGLGEGIDAAFVVLGDQPLLPPHVLGQMMTRAAQRGACILAPVYKGERGHPVMFHRTFWPALLALPAHGQPRDVIAQNRAAFEAIEVNDDAILLDVDTPQAYALALKRISPLPHNQSL